MKNINFLDMVKSWNKQFKKEVNYFPVISAFCVSNSNRIKVLKDILKSSKDNKFSKYDRKMVLFKNPYEKIILKSSCFGLSYTIVTCLNKIQKTYNIIYYGKERIDKKVLNDILEKTKIPKGNIICFNKPKVLNFETFNIFKKEIKKYKIEDRGIVKEYLLLDKKIQKTINNLKNQESLEGFDFLISKLKTIKSTILCLVLDNQIQGLIGPMNIFKDADNNKIVSAFYFGVSKRYRRQGYGELLFKSFVNLCYLQGIKYFLVTNGEKSKAAMFYKKMGAKVANKYYKIKNIKEL